MPQLRDAKTSELIAEGTPLEVALAARELGADEVLFDDVGESFDPAAVIAAGEERAAGLESAIADPDVETTPELEEHARQAAAALEPDADLVERAGRELQAARGRADV